MTAIMTRVCSLKCTAYTTHSEEARRRRHRPWTGEGKASAWMRGGGGRERGERRERDGDGDGDGRGADGGLGTELLGPELTVDCHRVVVSGQRALN